jgi:hypothetical protein
MKLASVHDSGGTTDPLAAHLGPERAAAVHAELAAAGCTAIDDGELARLRKAAAGYARLAALVAPTSEGDHPV